MRLSLALSLELGEGAGDANTLGELGDVLTGEHTRGGLQLVVRSPSPPLSNISPLLAAAGAAELGDYEAAAEHYDMCIAAIAAETPQSLSSTWDAA